MITTKQRAYLRSIAQNYDSTMQIGKDALKDESLKQIEDMLSKRELVKINVLKNCDNDVKDLANNICEKIGCDIVQVIGRVLVFYKRSNRKDVKHIELI